MSLFLSIVSKYEESVPFIVAIAEILIRTHALR